MKTLNKKQRLLLQGMRNGPRNGRDLRKWYNARRGWTFRLGYAGFYLYMSELVEKGWVQTIDFKEESDGEQTMVRTFDLTRSGELLLHTT